MKNIEITAEWILGILPCYAQADGYGTITLMADNLSDSHWIDLALDTMGVIYDSDIIDDDLDLEDPDGILVFWDFKIDEIKYDCPNLFAEWKRMDLINSLYNRKN